MTSFDDPQFLWNSIDHIAEKTANAPCPFCGTGTWAYSKNSEGNPRVSMITHWGGKDNRITLPAITLVCETCGFVRQHDLAMIATHLDRKDGQS